MRWVDVPFTIDNDKMYTQQTQWPQRCACCDGSHDGATYPLTAKLRTDYIDTGAYKSESGFSVGFPIPYCTDCSRHAGPIANIQAFTWVGAFLLWVLVGWLLFVSGLGESAIGIILFLASAIAIGAGAYQVSKRLVASMSTARMKAECTASDYVVSVWPLAGNWRFQFENDGYAFDFANINQLSLLEPTTDPQ